jgi:hypothetical protein
MTIAENPQNLAGHEALFAKFPKEITAVRNLPASNQSTLLRETMRS